MVSEKQPQVGDTVMMKGKLYKIDKIVDGKAHLTEVPTGRYVQ